MRDLEHARAMLAVAQRDLRAIEGMREDIELFDDAIFGFHAQQAAEKALKAWLSLVGVEYPRTHDLRQLLDLLQQNGECIPEAFQALIPLTDFAVQLRYELLIDLDTQLDRSEQICQVAQVVAHVANLIRDAEEAK